MPRECSCLAVVHCGQLVTLAGPARPRIRDELKDLAILSDAGMLVRDGRITDIGPSADIEREITTEYEVFDAHGRVVLPGFVDAHTHAVFAGTRVNEYELRSTGATYEQIGASGGGIRASVRQLRAASEDELFDVSRRYADWFRRSGTTTLECKSGYGLSLLDELKMLRIIRRLNYVPTFLGAHEIPDEYRAHPSDYVDLIVNEMLPTVTEQNLAEYCDVFCERNVFDVPTSRRILLRARSLGLQLRIHADQLSRSGAAQLAGDLNTVSADHLEQIDDSGICALAAAKVQPVLLPASVYNLGLSRFAPARAMIDAGLAIVLATDFNPGSSPTPSMPLVLSLASTHMHLTPAEGIAASTINAAYSLNRGHEIGSLEPGKRANFVVHNCRDYREIAYFAGAHLTAAVFVSGELLYEQN